LVRILLVKAALPPGLWSITAAVIAGAAIHVAVLNMLLLPGHLTRICLLAREATPIHGS